jgi:hypothetical protein
MPKTKAIKKFEKENVRGFSTEAVEAVQKVMAKYGISVKYGGGKYGELEFDLKLKLQCESTDGETQAMKDYLRYAEAYGLPIEMLGASLKIGGAAYEVTGFLPKRRKNNLQLLRLSDGKAQICPHDYAIRAFGEAQQRQSKAGSKAKGTLKGLGVGMARHPFDGECNEKCTPEKGMHVVYDSATARGR